MVRKIWTHQDIRAAADGTYLEHAASLSRRSVMRGGAAMAGAAMMGPLVPGMARADVGGDLQIMVWEGFDMQQSMQGWKDQNNVNVDISIITTQDDVQAKFLGGSPVPIDVTSYNQAYNKFYVDELGIIQPLDLSKIPNYSADDIFAGFHKTPLWNWNGEQWAVPFVWGLNSLVYNPAMMEAPTSYTDLLAPELKGKIAIVDEVTGTWPIAARLAGYGDKYPNLTREELAETFEVMKEYREQSKLFAASNGDLISLFNSGDIAAVFNAWTGIPGETAKAGVETAYVIPKEGAVMWSDALFVPKAADNVETAHEFINQSMDPKVQAALAEATGSGTVSKKAVEMLNAETRALFDYDDFDSVFANSPLEGIAPRESDEFATYDDWVRAYEDLKIGL